MILLALLSTGITWLTTASNTEQDLSYDALTLIEDSTLTIIALPAGNSYYTHTRKQHGYDYQTIAQFAQTNRLELEVIEATSFEHMWQLLSEGKGDLCIFPTDSAEAASHHATLCGPRRSQPIHLLQFSPYSTPPITNIEHLDRHELFVIMGTRYERELITLNNDLGGTIRITPLPPDSITIDDLVDRVVRGQLENTLVDSELARLVQSSHKHVNTSIILSNHTALGWTAPRNSRRLIEMIDKWCDTTDLDYANGFAHRLKRYRRSQRYYNPVYERKEMINDRQVSRYDTIFRHWAKEVGIDWHLAAAVAYQESRFNPYSVGGRAFGMMGIQINTGKLYQIAPDSLLTPQGNIEVGVRYLERVMRLYPNANSEEDRMALALASYNAGYGHLLDARALARKYGKDPERWQDVSEYLALKNDSIYYNDSIVKQGKFNAAITIPYVQEVMERRARYQSSCP